MQMANNKHMKRCKMLSGKYTLTPQWATTRIATVKPDKQCWGCGRLKLSCTAMKVQNGVVTLENSFSSNS